MTRIIPKYRVAITPTSEKELYALQYAFAGEMAHGEHQECKDDVLVAALLGWHLRKIGRHPESFIKSIVQEFYNRARVHLDARGESLHPDKLSRHHANRGTPSTSGHILTIDGIDSKTVSRIEARAHGVKRMLARLKVLSRNNDWQESYTTIDFTLARYSDQAIMDLNIWLVLTMSAQPDEVIEDYPSWIKDEIQARGQARAEHEAGTLVGDDQEETSGSTELPPLSQRERRAFLLRRRIHPGEKFWTDERIRAAMQMGL